MKKIKTTTKGNRPPKASYETRQQWRRRTKHFERWSKMKWLKYEDEILDGAGFPIIIPDPNRENQKQWERDSLREREKAVAIAQKNALPDVAMQQIPRPIIDANFRQSIIYFFNSGTWQRNEDGTAKEGRTIEEQDWDLHIVRAMQKPDVKRGLIEIDEKALDWLKTCLREEGSLAFRGTSLSVLRERFNDEFILDGEPPKETGESNVVDFTNEN